MNTGIMGEAPVPPRGVTGWLEPGDYEAAERFLADCRACHAAWLRLPVTVQQWHDQTSRAWLSWLAERAAAEFELIVALYREFPSGAALAPVCVGDATGYRHTIDTLGEHLCDYSQWLELADPLGPSVWPDTSMSSATLLRSLRLPDHMQLCLGGLPLDAVWVSTAWAQGLLSPVSAVAFTQWPSGEAVAPRLPGLTGDSTVEYAPQVWLAPERLPPGAVAAGRLGASLRDCVELLDTAVDRFFFPLRPPPIPRLHAAVGLESGGESLAARLLADDDGPGLAAVSRLVTLTPTPEDVDLVVGGAGFIGCNMAARLAEEGRNVLILDNLSRPGSEYNLSWLGRRYPGRIRTLAADIRDEDAVHHAVARARRVFHFAAQVAVTASLVHPRHDLQVNAAGTLNLLEAIRRRSAPPPLLFTSTNKVYGGLPDIELRRAPSGYEPVDPHIRAHGIDEQRPLALCSPYGCSKGAADQYVLDYARELGLSTVVLRMSCICGPRQFGNEDQGWVAHFVRCALAGDPVTVYGDGFQVRDVLFIDDLIDAALLAMETLPATSGEAFNIGGGPQRVLSLNRLLSLLDEIGGRIPTVERAQWRAADQRYYVSDTSKFCRATGWQPQVTVDAGVVMLYEWMQQHVLGGVADAQTRGQVAV